MMVEPPGIRASQPEVEQRSTERHPVSLSARLTWKDSKGTTRLATLKTRNISDTGVLVDCVSGSAIPLYRLVNFQVDRAAWDSKDLPTPLQRTEVLAAIYRVGPCRKETGLPAHYALRMLVEPDRRRQPGRSDRDTQTAHSGGARPVTRRAS